MSGTASGVTQRATDQEVFFRDAVDFRCFSELLEVAVDRARWKLPRLLLHEQSRSSAHPDAVTNRHEWNVFFSSASTSRRTTRHGRRGALVQGRYKATLVETEDRYLECLRYLAMNPVGAGDSANDPTSGRGAATPATVALRRELEELLRQELDTALR